MATEIKLWQNRIIQQSAPITKKKKQRTVLRGVPRDPDFKSKSYVEAMLQTRTLETSSLVIKTNVTQLV